ncbi:MAG: hypothetical protein H0W62_12640 [Chitinophagales bacterium]|nr:hypothetical protein [Chitinophagales bacterium]
MKTFKKLLAGLCLACGTLSYAYPAFSYTVSNLSASYKSGQVFLIWKNPKANNLKYNVYRSTKKITSPDQLSSNYLGNVRDNSGQNIRKSDAQKSYNFITPASSDPLSNDEGLYVITCTDEDDYFYAVTVVNLNNDSEDKTIDLGENSLSGSIAESVGFPQPVLQNSETLTDGVIQYEYVQWGNNQDTKNCPAFNNAGSYGYNFSLFDRGKSKNGPLYVYFKDNNPFSEEGTDLCDNCTVLKMDDWLPNGGNTYWVGYNENYDIYSETNPVAKKGTVKTYSQARVKKTLQWVRNHWAIDSNKVYLTGNSHNGFGALLTSVVSPKQVAAIYVTSTPILVKTVDGDIREQMWCDNSLNLPSDVTDPNTGAAILIWDLMDSRHMYNVDKNDIPFNSGVNGKNDVTAGWVQKFHWYDSLNATRQGGVWYWDQRVHGGGGAQFTDAETTPDYERYRINRSYPAFAYCSINEDPGTGDPNDGDDYGAINGYLDWDDASIEDEACNYSITCFIKDLYVGGSPDKNQYSSCTSDITFRREQNFKPEEGDKITWSVINSGTQIQNGSFTYNGGPITLYGVKIYKSKSEISLKISKCSRTQKFEAQLSDPIKVNVVPIPGGYEMVLNLPFDDHADMKILDMSGKVVIEQHLDLAKGLNSIPVQSLNNGFYIAMLQGSHFRQSAKLDFLK